MTPVQSETMVGFEPTRANSPFGFADRCLEPLGHIVTSILGGIRTRDLRLERAAATPQTHEDNSHSVAIILTADLDAPFRHFLADVFIYVGGSVL